MAFTNPLGPLFGSGLIGSVVGLGLVGYGMMRDSRMSQPVRIPFNRVSSAMGPGINTRMQYAPRSPMMQQAPSRPVRHIMNTPDNRDTVLAKIKNTVLLPVPTLSNGDCLFAAFAMALRGVVMPLAEQSEEAAKLRAQVVQFMLHSPEYKNMWTSIDSRMSQDDLQRQARQLSSHAFNAGMKALYNKHLQNAAAGNRTAYAELMSLQGMWGGEPELAALALMHRVPIVVIHGPFVHMRPAKGSDVYRTLVSEAAEDNKFVPMHVAGLQFARSAEPVFLRSVGDVHYEALLSNHTNVNPKKVARGTQWLKRQRRFKWSSQRKAGTRRQGKRVAASNGAHASFQGTENAAIR